MLSVKTKKTVIEKLSAKAAVTQHCGTILPAYPLVKGYQFHSSSSSCTFLTPLAFAAGLTLSGCSTLPPLTIGPNASSSSSSNDFVPDPFALLAARDRDADRESEAPSVKEWRLLDLVAGTGDTKPNMGSGTEGSGDDGERLTLETVGDAVRDTEEEEASTGGEVSADTKELDMSESMREARFWVFVSLRRLGTVSTYLLQRRKITMLKGDELTRFRSSATLLRVSSPSLPSMKTSGVTPSHPSHHPCSYPWSP